MTTYPPFQRLVTICGPAGAGKTAVALAAAEYLSERRHFRHGVFVLRGLSASRRAGAIDNHLHGKRTPSSASESPAHIASTAAAQAAGAGVGVQEYVRELARELGVWEPSEAAVTTALQCRHVLLVWDQLDPADAEVHALLSRLLQHTRDVAFIVTSRTPLSDGRPVEVLSHTFAHAQAQEEGEPSTERQFSSEEGGEPADEVEPQSQSQSQAQAQSQLQLHASAPPSPTSRALFGAGEKVVELGPLAALDAAQLLMRRSPRHISPGELGVHTHEQMLDRLAADASFAAALGYVPGRIVAAAPKLRNVDLRTFLAQRLAASRKVARTPRLLQHSASHAALNRLGTAAATTRRAGAQLPVAGVGATQTHSQAKGSSAAPLPRMLRSHSALAVTVPPLYLPKHLQHTHEHEQQQQGTQHQ